MSRRPMVMNDVVPVVLSREAVIEQLKALIPAAEAEDKKALAEHQAVKKRYLKAFHEACREAAKWDYETGESHGWRPQVKLSDGDDRKLWGLRRCPASKANRIKRIVAMVERTTQTKFTLSRTGKNGMLWELLVAPSLPKEADVCG